MAAERISSPLHDAARVGDVSKLEALLDAEDANPDLLDENGCAPLHYASMWGHPEVLNVFRQRRLNLALRDKHGRSPASMALALGRLDSLVWFGENPTGDAPREEGESLARAARGLGYERELVDLLQKGDLIQALPPHRRVSLPWPVLAAQAVLERRKEDLRTLLQERGCDPNAEVYAVCPPGSTLLHLAVSLEDEHIVSCLLEFGADKDAKNNIGESPKDVAHRMELSAIGAIFLRPSPCNKRAYKNNSYPKGLVVVFNNTFADSSNAKVREGAHRDITNIKTLFETLDYEVVVHEDLDYKNTMRELESISKCEDLVRMDSAIFFLLSHGGDKGSFRSTCNKEIFPDTFMRMFDNDSCRGLAGKPKIWFFGFCRGEVQEKEIFYTECALPLEIQAVPEARVLTVNTGTSSSRRKPLEDTLAVFPVQFGFKTIRDPISGSLGVYYFCEAIKYQKFESIDVILRCFTNAMKTSYTTTQLKFYGWDKAFYFSHPSF